jgi:hypothetical protein
MRRREFITLLGGAAALWPLATRAQSGMMAIGFLSSRSPGESDHLVAAFRRGADLANMRVAVIAEPCCAAHFASRRPDCVAGVVGLEPANPSARYLIGIA